MVGHLTKLGLDVCPALFKPCSHKVWHTIMILTFMELPPSEQGVMEFASNIIQRMESPRPLTLGIKCVWLLSVDMPLESEKRRQQHTSFLLFVVLVDSNRSQRINWIVILLIVHDLRLIHIPPPHSRKRSQQWNQKRATLSFFALWERCWESV